MNGSSSPDRRLPMIMPNRAPKTDLRERALPAGSAAGEIGDEAPNRPWSTVLAREQELRAGFEGLGTPTRRNRRSRLGRLLYVRGLSL
jgi:hypothetical protein